MTSFTDTEEADRIGRRRARMTIFLALYFMAGQAVFLTNAAHDPMRAVDRVRVSAWLAWAVVLMILLATGGGWFRAKAVRALLDGEGTRANRAIAFMWGFWGAMAMALVLYVVSLFEPLAGRDAIHLILTAGVGTALLRFGILERRALRDA